MITVERQNIFARFGEMVDYRKCTQRFGTFQVGDIDIHSWLKKLRTEKTLRVPRLDSSLHDSKANNLETTARGGKTPNKRGTAIHMICKLPGHSYVMVCFMGVHNH